MKVISIIPARYSSTRFPAKPLANICGKPMVQHVYERVAKSAKINEVIVATDHEEIYRKVESFKGKAIMTNGSHNTGTDRVAEAALKLDGDIILNVQGDEPLIQPELITLLVEEAIRNPSSVITAKTLILDKQDIDNPNVVKVVTDLNNNALYFSRSPIPFNRSGTDLNCYKHLGIYCYPIDLLNKFIKLPVSLYEEHEMLEQLRLLENGINIKVVETNYNSIGVDTKEDIVKVEKYLKDDTID
ncbi:3-deoxy-manno-octulosonate cytidylyltransferase [Sporosarcina globispora]|uniref:3-deoxy-manno-octulosonate cytidylyltransferase n=1 Tax=Sporosarcina globispora TaxID=1459 RepID=A0A0M0GFW3_SPOGL|nr:3-deoxy-manno-octulosonate cytidylyltransferase [Sporosarcina globispora]KON88326.1 3-deoxy-manno-octulosonate cytidylyltransferase [Sporosarcina globispora]